MLLKFVDILIINRSLKLINFQIPAFISRYFLFGNKHYLFFKNEVVTIFDENLNS